MLKLFTYFSVNVLELVFLLYHLRIKVTFFLYERKLTFNSPREPGAVLAWYSPLPGSITVMELVALLCWTPKTNLQIMS